MIRQIRHENSTLYFLADDMGQPITGGYLSREQAEEAAALWEASEGQASLPRGIDLAAVLADQR